MSRRHGYVPGFVFALLLFLFVLAPRQSYAGDWTGNINFFLGAKALNEDDWKPVDEQGEFAIEGDFRSTDWPVSIAIDILGATDEANELGLDFESTTTEFNIGVRKIWDSAERMRPFVGGGISFMSAEVKVSAGGASLSTDDTGTGFWLGGGIYWTFNERFNIGFEAKYSSATVEFADVEVNAGGGHFGLILGVHL